MTPTAASRIGIEAWTVRDIRTWFERVRAGELDRAQQRATLLLTYRVWLVALLFKALGSGWDVAWHFRWLRDDFAPPHNVNLVGDGIAIVLVLCHWYTRFGVDRTALRLMVGGVALFVASAPIDVINHRINGLDITSWSITHFGLYTGTAILIAGVIRGWRLQGAELPGRAFMLTAFWAFFLENVFFPNQQQEYGTLAIRAYDAGHPTAEPILMDFAAQQAKVSQLTPAIFHHFALPIPAWVYPLWMGTAVTLALLAARRSVGLRWTATTIAAVYVLWRCVMWVLLISAHFPRSTVPFVLVLVGLAVDLVLLAGRGWPTEAVLGAIAVTAVVYLGLFGQDLLVAAPPVSYWSAPVTAVLLGAGWAALAWSHSRRKLTLF